MKFNTRTIHGGQKPEKSTGAMVPPIFQTSTYAQSSPGTDQEYNYSRGANPTRTALEDSFASIENGTHGFAFSSGLAAIDCVLRTLNPGDEVIAGNGSVWRNLQNVYKIISKIWIRIYLCRYRFWRKYFKRDYREKQN